MQKFDFEYPKKKKYQVIIDRDNDHKFTTDQNGNTLERAIKGFEVNYKSKSVTVSWAEVLKDKMGIVISSEAKEYIESSPGRFHALYDLGEFSEASGDFYAKQAINGVMERTIGIKVFLPDGDFEIQAI